MNTKFLALGLLATTALVAGCKDEKKAQAPAKAEYAQAAPKPAASPSVPIPQFKDITAEAGISFVGVTGAEGKKLMPETMGAGVGMADLFGDGWLDLIMVNGRPWDRTKPCPPLVTIYRNLGDGHFRDVTAQVGLGKLCGYGMGLAIADYDGSGRPGIFVTSLDGNHLLHNDGGGHFSDVTEKAGLPKPDSGTYDWSSSAAWLDAFGNGRADLFVAHYVRWTPETDVYTTRDGLTKSYATPTVYEGVSNRLYRNRGDGTFEDATAEAGLLDDHNKGLGIVVLDMAHHGPRDLFVSNDTQPNKLYVNDGHGHFEDRALEYGIAYDETGRAKAGMGTDAADIGGGVLAIGVGNFSDEAVSHYELAPGGDTFTDGSPRRGLASATLADLTFGTRFADFNNDGRPDFLLINGHIEPDIHKVQASTDYALLPRLFLQDGSGHYLEYGQAAGKPLTAPMVGRSVAIGDLFNDGNLDLLISTNGGPPKLLRNVSPARGYVEVTLVGTGANRDALGASVTMEADNGWSCNDGVRWRGSYLASSPFTLHTGVPDGVTQVKLSVTWPDGSKTVQPNVAVGHHYKLTQDGTLTPIVPARAGG